MIADVLLALTQVGATVTIVPNRYDTIRVVIQLGERRAAADLTVANNRDDNDDLRLGELLDRLVRALK